MERDLNDLYDVAQNHIKKLDSGVFSPLSHEFHVLHADTLKYLAQCMSRVEQLALFSANESLEDVSTGDLKYFNLDYYVGHVLEATTVDPGATAVMDRVSVSKAAVRKFLDFLLLMDQYGIPLPPHFRALSSLDALLPQGRHGLFDLQAIRSRLANPRQESRQTKIDNHKYVKGLRDKLDQNVRALTTAGARGDEETLRDVEISRLQLHSALAWEAIKGAISELELLRGIVASLDPSGDQKLLQEPPVPYIPVTALHPDTLRLLLGNNRFEKVDTASSNPESTSMPSQSSDHGTKATMPELWSWEASEDPQGMTLGQLAQRWRVSESREASTRVESEVGPNGTTADHLRGLHSLLGAGGRPNRPFTIVGQRQNVARNVFGTGQKLPTITIEELLKKELSGQMLQRGDPAPKAENDEDSYAADDAATEKARQWDEFTEANPRGSGNTLNMG